MTIHEKLISLADGNPGAINVLVKLLTETVIGFVPEALIRCIEDNKLQGSTLWMLYKDRNNSKINELCFEFQDWIEKGAIPLALRAELDSGQGFLSPRPANAPAEA